MINVKEEMCSALALKTHPLIKQFGTGKDNENLYDPCPLSVCTEKLKRKNRDSPSNIKKTILRVIGICYPKLARLVR